ncbi:General negative regulator of transcription subunit 4 [Spathaspora sp. JA1]|nr:General negative regulator of transcription subunit 4 [Spathaspora sp. JA1]
MIPPDDSFISDNEEEYCPLCVEEMDISDKNFKPCPCGYQICQFCYNNIKQNPELNGRCPGCRRLYDDDSVEYKSISAEEYRLQQLKKEKREREKKQREKEKKETEMANKKHLAGLRVVQKNLVYVTGLNPPCNPEDLHSVLRSEKYFGQYGKISKIVINKKTPNPATSHHSSHHHQSIGIVVYVTFARKEDALTCINELDGSLCDGRILRAAHGTTKYCSSYLRGHPCPNPNCMFLHEPGEEADSYTRKDLSTQQGIKIGMMGLMGASSRQANIGGQATTHTNGGGDEDNNSHTSDEDHEHPKSVLPATASWAKESTWSAGNSPSVNNNVPVANPAAFPTLGEIFKQQQQQQQPVQQSLQPQKKDVKIKGKLAKSPRDNIIADELEDDSAIQFIEEATEQLRSLKDQTENFQIQFKQVSKQTQGKILPLFSFDRNIEYNCDVEDEKLIARQVIERFLLRPIKNYHLAYQNHPIAQQQTLLQRQQQQQQQQQAQVQQAVQGQTPNLQLQQLQQKGGDIVEQQKQVQQQMLLLQLQQQQLQQQQLQQQQKQQQLNMLRANERGTTSTPPPPGLFAGKPQVPQQPQYEVPEATNIQSSSSQLLTQLMSGKR